MSILEKFKPNVWAKYEWGLFSDPYRYVQVLWYCFFVLSVDCNNFFLKYIFWLPPEHYLMFVRLAIWAFSAIASTKEYYEYMANKYCYKIGPFVWLTCMTLLVEFSIITKFGAHMFTAAFPGFVKVIWLVIGILVLIGGIYSCMNDRKRKELIQVSKKGIEADTQYFNPFDPPIDIEPVKPHN